jgi:hypothetical protein
MKPTALPILLSLSVVFACGGEAKKTDDKADAKKAEHKEGEQADAKAGAESAQGEPTEKQPEAAGADEAKAAENAKLPAEKIELAKLHEGYFADKSGWVGRKVELTATYLNTNVVKSGDTQTTSLSLTTDVENFSDAPGASCTLLADEKADGIMQGTQLRIEASVKGDIFDNVELVDCHIAEVIEPEKVAEAQ